MIGQVRGFNLDEFLSDWEPDGQALPWAVGDGAWVKSASDPEVEGKTMALYRAMAAEGVSPTIKVLYVPDYVSAERRLTATAELRVRLGQFLPGANISLALAPGPFEDTDGIGAHFEAKALGGSSVQKQVNDLKVDLHVSVAHLARHVTQHTPRLIFGEGQGAVVATAYGHPGCLEQVLMTRNVQPVELPSTRLLL